MAVEDQVVSDLGEGVGLVVCDGLLSAIDNAGLQCAVQLTEGDDGGVSAQTLDHAVHDGVVGHAQLQALEISDAGNGLDREEVTEALLAVEDTTNGQTQLLGLVQELRCQLAVGEVPEVCAVLEGEGDGQQLGLVAAVAGQCESGDTADVDGGGAAEDSVQNVVLRTQNAGSLHIDDDGAAGQLFDLLLEVGSGLADDGIQRVDLGVDQSHLRVGSSSCGITGGSGGSCSRGSGRSSSAVAGATAGGQCQSSGGNTGCCQKAATRNLLHDKILLRFSSFRAVCSARVAHRPFIYCTHFSKFF